MNIVLLSGGSGKRLWPLSNDIRSKQFIKIFRNDDAPDGLESMLQRVYRQIKAADPESDITIATSRSQVSSIHNQLGEAVSVCVEPCRRDTFPAIVLSCAYLRDVKGIDPSEAVVVCPVDPYVEQGYFDTVNELWELAQNGEASLVLMGIDPTYPSEKYGYIIPESTERISTVLEFREKPDAATAQRYIDSGGLWNGGVFAFRIGHVLERAGDLIGFTDYNDLYSRYEELEKISFDYAFVEHEKNTHRSSKSR